MPHFLTNINDIKNNLSVAGDEARVDSQLERFNMYYDDYEEAVENLLREQFHRDNWADMLKMLYVNYNFLKKVVNLKTVVYKKEAKRRYLTGTTTEGEGDSATETDEFSEDYEEIINDSNINSAIQQVDLYANINNISTCRIKRNINKDGIEYIPTPSHEISIEQHPEDPLQVVGLIHTVKISDTPGDIKRLYFYWTTGESVSDTPIEEGGERVGHYRIYNDDGELVEQKNNKDDVNPYKTADGKYIIPYVFFRTVESNEFWNEMANRDLYDTTLQVNVNYTHKNNMMKFFGYDQKFILGDVDVTQLQGKRTDPSTIIQVKPVNPGDSIDIKSIELSGRLKELDGAIFVSIAQTADIHGVSLAADAMTAQRQTAEALTINRRSLVESREKLIPGYRESEDELAFKTIIIANTPTQDTGLGKSIPEDGTFQIDFADLEDPATAKEKAEVDVINISQNLDNPVSIIMRDNPDLDQDQATEVWENNKAINNNNSRALSLTPPIQPGLGEEVEPLPDDSTPDNNS